LAGCAELGRAASARQRRRSHLEFVDGVSALAAFADLPPRASIRTFIQCLPQQRSKLRSLGHYFNAVHDGQRHVLRLIDDAMAKIIHLQQTCLKAANADGVDILSLEDSA